MDFKVAIKDAAEKFKSKLDSCIGILAHNDADGICSAAIICRALQRLGASFHILFITRAEKDVLEMLKDKSYKTFLFLDYGGREVNSIAQQIPNVNFFVLDHHPPSEALKENRIINVNPHFFNIDGGTEICAATLCYLFAKALDTSNSDLAYLAVIGAVGDSQRKDGAFIGVNQEVFEEALKNNLIGTEKGLKFYGWSSRPIHKALALSTEPFIPGISGSESAAVQFLQELGIELKKDGAWKTLKDLTDDEKKKLATSLILKRHNLKEHPESIFGERIFLKSFPFEELKEVEVISAWLNSCAKLLHFGLAIGASLGDKASYLAGQQHVQSYRKQIIDGLNYFYKNRKNTKVISETEKAIYFLGGSEVNSQLVSTVSTILSHNLEKSGKALFCFADINGRVKISARFVGQNPQSIALGQICQKVATSLGGEGGGHKMAAGATIPKDKEETFIKEVEKELNHGS